MTTSTFTWGTVTNISPFRVRLDGDTVELPITPDTLVDPVALAVDDRVRCEIDGTRLIVHGRSEGDAVWEDYTPALTQITLGSGVMTAKHRKLGPLRLVRWRLDLAADTVIGAGPCFALPTPAFSTFEPVVGGALAFDDGVDSYVAHVKITTDLAFLMAANGGYFLSTVPFTWAAGDYIIAQFAYLEAE